MTTTRPPRRLRRGAVPAARSARAYLGGTPPRNGSRQATRRLTASLFGLNLSRVSWHDHDTPPAAPEEGPRPRCPERPGLSGGHAPPERLTSSHASPYGVALRA